MNSSSSLCSPRMFGSVQPTRRCAALTALSRSSPSGSPKKLPKMRPGSFTDTSSTKSPSPRWAISVTRSRAWPRIQPSSRRTFLGLNASVVMPRSWVCRGASIAMNDCAISTASGAKSSMVMPWAEEKISGWRLAIRMSSCLVSDQKPLVLSSGGSRSDSAGRLHGTGFSRRRTAKARRVLRGACAQNDRALRSMSPWVGVGGGGGHRESSRRAARAVWCASLRHRTHGRQRRAHTAPTRVPITGLRGPASGSSTARGRSRPGRRRRARRSRPDRPSPRRSAARSTGPARRCRAGRRR